MKKEGEKDWEGDHEERKNRVKDYIRLADKEEEGEVNEEEEKKVSGHSISSLGLEEEV